MIFFTTPSTEHLNSELSKHHNFRQGSITIKQFGDGEWYVRVNSDVYKKQVLLIANTNAPADNLVLLMLVSNAITSLSPSTFKLLIPYFGYQKQDKARMKGEAVSTQALAEVVNTISADALYCVTLHSDVAREALKPSPVELDTTGTLARALIALPLSNPIVATPDHGSAARGVKLADELGGVTSITAEKERPLVSNEQVKKLSFDNVDLNGHDVVLVDDFVQSGGTIIKAVKNLRKLEADTIYLVLHHGFLYKRGLDKVLKLKLKKIIITNTLKPLLPHGKIDIVSIAGLIASEVL